MPDNTITRVFMNLYNLFLQFLNGSGLIVSFVKDFQRIYFLRLILEFHNYFCAIKIIFPRTVLNALLPVGSSMVNLYESEWILEELL